MIAGILFIVSGLLLNQWFLAPIINLTNGQASLLRVIVIWIFDITLITQGLLLLTKKKSLSFKPKKVFFFFIMFIIILLLSESMLHVAMKISPVLDQIITRKKLPRRIPDDELGYRPNPNYFEHDSNGFRNKIALSSSDIVALGDSQTYGTGVKSHQAWPHQLSNLSGRTVYSMSFGGYGSLQGLVLLKSRALKLKPKMVIFAMYDGNDLFDAYRTVYIQHLSKSFMSADPLINESITKLQQTDPLLLKIADVADQIQEGAPTQKKELPTSIPGNTVYVRLKQLKLMQFFFCLEGAIQKAFVNTRNRRWKELSQVKHQDSNFFEVFQTKDFKTVFAPAYRRIAIDLSDVRIEEGLRITLEALKEMKQIANDNSIEFLILMIPLKERVFYELYPENKIGLSQAMQWTISKQDEVRRRTVDYLKQNEIPYIDTLPILDNCFKLGRQPFFIDTDGHLNQAGQAAVAKAVNEYIQNNTKLFSEENIEKNK